MNLNGSLLRISLAFALLVLLLPTFFGTAVVPAQSKEVQPYTQAGELDPSFGTNGKVATDFGGSGDYAFAVALQPDGKIVVGGRINVGDQSDFALTRYNGDGSLDTSFGTLGKVTTHFNGGYNDTVTDIVLLPNGKIVAAGAIVGESSLDMALVRYNPDGSLDQGFGSGGKVVIDLGADEAAHAVALQQDGKIVIAGQTGGYTLADIALVRYNADGSPDQGFGSKGAVITHFNGGDNVSVRDFDVAIQPDGKIVALGYYQEDYATDTDFALTRYNADGSLDATFGNGGEVITDFAGRDDNAFALALQPDGKIFATGYTKVGYRNNDIASARYNSDGSLDTSFGNNGKVTVAFTSTSSEASYAAALQPDGKIIVAGHTGNYPIFDFALVRYTSDGQLDSSFGNGGKVATDFFGQSDQAYAITLQSDGRIIVAGDTRQGSVPLDFGVARYLSSTGCGYSLSPTSMHLPSSGGSGVINLTTGTGCAWLVENNLEWILITSNTSGSGNASISFEARENFTASVREGTLRIGGQDFTVIQDGSVGGDCSFAISPTFNSVPAAGGAGSVNIATSEQCAWEARRSVSWITITSPSTGIGNGSVNYSAAANPSPGSRKGTIVIGGQTFVVKQKGR